MSATVDSASRPTVPTSLRELLERVPQVLNAQSPGALHMQSRASADAMESVSRAEARLLKSAETFHPHTFSVSVLENLGRRDPFIEPGDEDFPDQAADDDLEAERRRVDEITDRALSEQQPLRSSAERVEEQAMHLQERIKGLTLQVEADPALRSSGGARLSIMDKVYAGDDRADEREADIRNEETLLREDSQALGAVEAKRTVLAERAAAVRAELLLQQREVDLLEREQHAVALAAAETAATGAGGAAAGSNGWRAEASREMENLVGVAGMPEARLEACEREEDALVRRNTGIRDWYAATVAEVENLGGVRLSHRLLFGAGAGGRVEGMEFMVGLGSGLTMEVTVSAVDGKLSSAQLCHGQGGGGAAGFAGISPSELEEMRRAADALPAPQNLGKLVIEALSRATCAAVREEHVRQVRRRYLTGYRSPSREVTVTMGAGIVACFHLAADYPKVVGGAEVVALTGVGGWSAHETKQLCRRVNDMALPTLMATMDVLEAEVEAMEGGD
ncbi:unnamed protein product [Ectocarpus sp. CCAP 1310/34]|nr:unnamed protein product [Ectocarpus sp. CCAP 1310/34]